MCLYCYNCYNSGSDMVDSAAALKCNGYAEFHTGTALRQKQCTLEEGPGI